MIERHLKTPELAEKLRPTAVEHARAVQYQQDIITRRYGQTAVYVFAAAHGVKVGITTQTLDQRAADIERASGVAIEIVAGWLFARKTDAYRIEKIAHWLLRDFHTLGEWFRCDTSQAVATVERALDEPGIYLSFLQWRDAQRATA